MKNHPWWGALLALVCAGAAGAQEEVPDYFCWKTALLVTIDGRGDEPAWQEAPPAELVDVRFLSGDRYHSRRTEARMLWDDLYFYFLFTASDPDVWSTYSERDMQLWQEEVVEIFIDPDGDGRNYAEVEVNPLNAVFDLLVSGPWSEGGQGFAQWNPQLATAVQVTGTVNDPADTDQGWGVEVALPWTSLGRELLDVPGEKSLPPQPGDEWRLNLYRFERVRQNGTESESQASAWSPVGRVDFHVPERFGKVVFRDRLTAVAGTSWAEVKAGEER